MGIYVNSQEEISDAIAEVLNNLEGEVFKIDFKKACKDLEKQYKFFSK